MKGGGHKTIGFFLVHLCYIPGRNMRTAIRAIERAVILGKVNRALHDSIVIHFHKIALADFLVFGDKTLAMGATNRKEMATANLLTVWIWINWHITGVAVH